MVEHLIWDDDNRLVQVTGMGANQRNVFDAAGLRVLRHGRGDTIFSSQYFEYDNAKTGTKHVFAGSMRVAAVLAPFTSGATPQPPTKRGTAFFLHENQLGSTAVVTTEDGQVNDAHEYFPDGGDWIDSGKSNAIDNYLFSGKPFDPDTGFYDYGQRFYDPRTSVWLGIDAIFLRDAQKAVGAPGVLSPLAYAASSPLRFSDPDGLQPDDVPQVYRPQGQTGAYAAEAADLARRWETASPIVSTATHLPPDIAGAEVGLFKGAARGAAYAIIVGGPYVAVGVGIALVSEVPVVGPIAATMIAGGLSSGEGGALVGAGCAESCSEGAPIASEATQAAPVARTAVLGLGEHLEDFAPGRGIPWYNWTNTLTRRSVWGRGFGRALTDALRNAEAIKFNLEGITDYRGAFLAGRAGFRYIVRGGETIVTNATNTEFATVIRDVGLRAKTTFYRGGQALTPAEAQQVVRQALQE